MKKIVAMVRVEALQTVMDAIREAVDGVTVSEVAECSSFGVQSGSYRGSKFAFYPPAWKLEVVTTPGDVDEIVRLILAESDGELYVQDVADALRIRNGQCGVASL